MVSGIRQAVAANAFYPAEPASLQKLLKNYFSKTKVIKARPQALILPHAGYVYSGQTASWGFKQLKRDKNQHFVLLGPSHQQYFTGLAGSTAKFWQTAFGRAEHLADKQFSHDSPHLSEHCLEVQLPFLQYLYKPGFSFTAFLTGKLKPQETAKYLINHYPGSIFLISSDLSHYLPEDQANQLDNSTIEAILQLNSQYFDCNDNVACGSTAIQVLINLAKTQSWQAKLLCYDTSSSASGDKNQVVGYASIGFYEK